MRALVLRSPREPLQLTNAPIPEPRSGQIRLRVEACAVCRTDLHVVDGELTEPKLPLIPGHQIVGRTAEGRRFGVPWLGWTCGVCAYCTGGRENLCDAAKLTGYTLDGGYAEWAVADERFCFPIPDEYTSEEAAPLLCAGLIGYRAYRMLVLGEVEGTGDARRLGFYGFGSAAQILAQIARADGREVYAVTREGDSDAQALARRMGATVGVDAPLDAAIVFAPVGALVVEALQKVVKGGSVICAGIHMSDIPSFPYSLLWGERVIRSVANLTRQDGLDLFERLRTLRVETKRTLYRLEDANQALDDLRSGKLTGTAVLVP